VGVKACVAVGVEIGVGIDVVRDVWLGDSEGEDPGVGELGLGVNLGVKVGVGSGDAV
jgi:hypothetical protein